MQIIVHDCIEALTELNALRLTILVFIAVQDGKLQHSSAVTNASTVPDVCVHPPVPFIVTNIQSCGIISLPAMLSLVPTIGRRNNNSDLERDGIDVARA